MFDETQVRRAIALMYSEPGAIIEVRALKLEDGGALSQYFDASQIDKLVKAVSDMTQMGAGGVYTVLNEINRFTVKQNMRGTWCRTSSGETSDVDIASRRLLLIDIDPKRPADTSSNQAELTSAIDCAMEIRSKLNGLTWPQPILACSGNGIHLIYRLPDLPNSIESTRIVQGVLIRLASEHNSDALDIDKSVFNAARISKLYGTVARKGLDTTERPHRVGFIMQAPDVLAPVSKDLLLEFASAHMPADLRTSVVSVMPSKRLAKAFTAEDFMLKYGIHYTKKLPYNDNGYKYWVTCPWASEHSYTNEEDTCVFQTADGALGFRCSHAHCLSRQWVDFREKYEPRVTVATAQAGRVVDGQEEADLLLEGEGTFNDESNALRMVRFMAGGIRYCENQNSWYVWESVRFKKCRTINALGAVHDMFQRLKKQVANVGAGEQFAKFFEFNAKAAAPGNCLLRLKALVEIESTELDANRDALNFLNGTLDLGTGVLHPHNKSNLITKLVNCNYMPDAKCPTWEACLNKILPDQKAALQVALGYSMTGWTTEKKIFICWGEIGDNGKSTVMSTILDIFGEYSKKLNSETLMKSKTGLSSNASDDIGDLAGKRYVNISELDEGRAISESLLKDLSAGTGFKTSTRKYESATQFLETYCLWLDTNPFPKISTNDSATWRRLYAFHFGVHLQKHEIDLQMSTKLLAEREGVVAWVVAGARSWYARKAETGGSGLMLNTAGDDAIEDHRATVDTLTPFIEEALILGLDSTKTHVGKDWLWSAYMDWVKANGGFKSTKNQLEARILSLGCGSARRQHQGKKIQVFTGVEAKKHH